jgi:hypothetical protein
MVTPPVGNDNESSSDSEKFEEFEQPEPVEWDFVLPDIPHPGSLLPRMGCGDGGDDFGIEDLAGAVLHGADLQAIRNYLASYDERTVRRH